MTDTAHRPIARLTAGGGAAVAALLLLGAAAPAPVRLPLASGDYVAVGNSCKDPAFAVLRSFKAGAFSYPHASGCSDEILARRTDRYRVRETCRLNGDGSPATPATQTLDLRIAARDRFTLLGPRGTTTFRLCPGPTD